MKNTNLIKTMGSAEMNPPSVVYSHYENFLCMSFNTFWCNWRITKCNTINWVKDKVLQPLCCSSLCDKLLEL